VWAAIIVLVLPKHLSLSVIFGGVNCEVQRWDFHRCRQISAYSAGLSLFLSLSLVCVCFDFCGCGNLMFAVLEGGAQVVNPPYVYSLSVAPDGRSAIALGDFSVVVLGIFPRRLALLYALSLCTFVVPNDGNID
jgi:hypothetical protein